MKKSYIQKFIFDHLPIKGAMVVLNDSWQAIAAQKNYPKGVKQLLGELLVANTLITSNLKLEGKVICQIQENKHFKLVVSECSNNFNVRGTAKFEALDEVLMDYATYLDSGRLVVSIDSNSDGNLYQSIIAFNGKNVADILNNFMLQSEQLKSWFLIAYSDEQVVGFMLQQLPDTHHQSFHEIERVFTLAETLTERELLHFSLENLIFKLFNEDDVVVMPTHPVNFFCSCSRQRVSEILRNLGKEELSQLIAEQGHITVDCDYCNTIYRFEQAELEKFVLQISLDEIKAISNELH